MSSKLQPMLAAKIESEADLERLQFPLFLSPKIDGIRLRISEDLGAVSRTHKPIPNKHIQSVVKEFMPYLSGMDGEVTVGDPTAAKIFNDTQSAVMSESGSPPFLYHVFDHWYAGGRFDVRQIQLREQLFEASARFDYMQDGMYTQKLFLVTQTLVHSVSEVLHFEEQYLTQGYEGIILRSPTALYKSGRSTFKEHGLLKFKRVEDAEATIIGFEPLQRNTNALTRDVFGYAKRSSHKAGKVADNLLGKLLVEHPEFGEFAIGSGFDVATREEVWQAQERYLGRSVSFTFSRVGMKDKPRWPIFKGFRND